MYVDRFIRNETDVVLLHHASDVTIPSPPPPAGSMTNAPCGWIS